MNEVVESQPVETTPENAPSAPSFQDSLPEDLRGNASLKNFNDIGSLAKSYVHAQRMIGADKISLPTNNSPDDDWGVVYDKLGRPADMKDYDVSVPDIFEDDAFRQSIHRAGLNQKQAAEIADFMKNQNESSQEKLKNFQEQAKLDTETELRAEYGKAFEEKIKRAQAAAKYLLPELGDPTSKNNIFSNLQLADGRLLGDHPDVVRMFVDLSDGVAEEDLEGVTSENAMTPQDAQEEIDKLQADRKGPYWNKHHPQHDKAVARVQELFAYVHPEEDIVL